jgi:hypothetical protein
MRRTLLVAGVAVFFLAAPTAWAGHGAADNRAAAASTIAVIGDIPYGDALIAEFPADIAQINADPSVGRVVHLGDIKNGSTRCDTSYFQARLADFQTFEVPLVYTPGDNEWTDCHRANNGGYVPTERLDTIRRMFFPRHGKTLGQRPQHVDYQSDQFPENVRWTDSRVVFGAVHVVGSNDDHDVWFTDRTDPGTGQARPETRVERAARSREYTAREAAALAWIDAIFDSAERQHAPAVAIGMQADMWDSSAPAAELTAFDPIKAVLAERAEHFGKPVLLLEGDSHLFKVDTPPDMPANLTRVVIQGSTNMPHEWLRLHINPSAAQVFSCENVTFQTGTVTPCPALLAP